MNWKRTFIAILIAEGLAVAGFSTSMPIIPFFLQKLGATSVTAVNFWNGLIQTGAAISLTLFSPVWGSLADYYGRKKMLLRAMFGGAVVLGCLALANAPWQVLVLRIIQGCLTGTVAAATAMTASVVPENRMGFSLGLLQTFVFIGASTGPLLGGVISDLAGYRVNFLATAGLLLMAGLTVLIFTHEDFVPKKSKGSLLKNAIPNFRVIGTVPGLFPLFLVVFTVRLAMSIINPILPLYIQWLTPDVAILGTATGLILSISAGASAVSAATIGRISDRFGHIMILIICMAGAVIFYIPQGLVHSWPQLFVLRIFDGIFLGGTMPAVNALLTKRTPSESRGSVFGLSASFSASGLAIGPAIGAVTASFLGYRSVFFVTAILITLAGASVTFINSRKHL